MIISPRSTPLRISSSPTPLFLQYIIDVDVIPLAKWQPQTEYFDFKNIEFDNALILVVDPVESNQDLIKGILNDTRIDVLTVEDGISAINKLITVDKVKIVIGDIMSSVVLAIAPIAERNKVRLNKQTEKSCSFQT